MINFTSKTRYYISSNPTDMRNGREGLAGIVREVMGHNPKCYDEAFIFYSKDYKKVKILHYDLNGYVMYQKWFDNGKFYFYTGRVYREITYFKNNCGSLSVRARDTENIQTTINLSKFKRLYNLI